MSFEYSFWFLLCISSTFSCPRGSVCTQGRAKNVRAGAQSRFNLSPKRGKAATFQTFPQSFVNCFVKFFLKIKIASSFPPESCCVLVSLPPLYIFCDTQLWVPLYCEADTSKVRADVKPVIKMNANGGFVLQIFIPLKGEAEAWFWFVCNTTETYSTGVLQSITSIPIDVKTTFCSYHV